MSSRGTFVQGDDRLECPTCGTHNLLAAERCWNCGDKLDPARRLAFEHGQATKGAAPPSDDERH